MKKFISISILVCFLVTGQMGTYPIYAQEFRLPAPGVRVNLSPEFNPPILKGIKIHPDNPFRFDFILDVGDGPKPSLKGRVWKPPLREESTRLIKYFLASLTIPEKDLWVNLSPYEKDRIIPQSFGLTEMGRDLLAEDYMLKQITASLIYPDDEIGKKFWKRVYEEAYKKFGTTNIPVNTFNKVWIVPEKAVVYENAHAGTAYVVSSKLKVMLEQDYLALQKHASLRNDLASVGANIVREIVIPELTREVNENKNFAQLRQVYNSLILATWYKKKIKDSILEQVYANKNKTVGVQYDSTVIPTKTGPHAGHSQEFGIHNKNDVEAIYQRYLQAFKKGAYNYIKEEQDPMTQQIIPRKYFSGGMGFDGAQLARAETFMSDEAVLPKSPSDLAVISAGVNPLPGNQAMSSEVGHKLGAWRRFILPAIDSELWGKTLDLPEKKQFGMEGLITKDGNFLESVLLPGETKGKLRATGLGNGDITDVHCVAITYASDGRVIGFKLIGHHYKFSRVTSYWGLKENGWERINKSKSNKDIVDAAMRRPDDVQLRTLRSLLARKGQKWDNVDYRVLDTIIEYFESKGATDGLRVFNYLLKQKNVMLLLYIMKKLDVFLSGLLMASTGVEAPIVKEAIKVLDSQIDQHLYRDDVQMMIFTLMEKLDKIKKIQEKPLHVSLSEEILRAFRNVSNKRIAGKFLQMHPSEAGKPLSHEPPGVLLAMLGSLSANYGVNRKNIYAFYNLIMKNIKSYGAVYALEAFAVGTTAYRPQPGSLSFFSYMLKDLIRFLNARQAEISMSLNDSQVDIRGPLADITRTLAGAELTKDDSSSELVHLLLAKIERLTYKVEDSDRLVVLGDGAIEVLKGQEILVVDDGFLNRGDAKYYLKGANVTLAHNGREALDLINGRSKPFALVLTELEMPDMDGLTLIRNIRAKYHSQIPIILWTALILGTDQLSSLKALHVEPVYKPTDWNVLVFHIVNYFHNKAMMSASAGLREQVLKIEKNGGIDLTSAQVQTAGSAGSGRIKFHLDPAMLTQLQNAPGFVPVIINIQPLNDLRSFLRADISV